MSGMLYPYASSVGSTLAKRWMGIHGRIQIYQMWTVNQADGNDWLGNLEEMPHTGNSNCHDGVTRWLSLWVCPCVYPHVLYSFLVNTLFVSLLSVSVEILICSAVGPGPLSLTTGVVVGIWTLIASREPKPCFKPLQAEDTWMIGKGTEGLSCQHKLRSRSQHRKHRAI